MFRLVEEEDEDEKEAQDRLVGGDMYFDRDPTGLAGAELSQTIRKMNTPSSGEGYLLLDQDPGLYINNPNLTQQIYDRLLTFYLNNHKILINTSPLPLVRLVNLESWFIRVVEPAPQQSSMKYHEWRSEVDGRKKRERSKMNGYSYYCDESVRHKIKPKIPREVLIQVKENQKYI